MPCLMNDKDKNVPKAYDNYYINNRFYVAYKI